MKQTIAALAMAVSVISVAGCADMQGGMNRFVDMAKTPKFDPTEHGAVVSTEMGVVEKAETAQVRVNSNGVTAQMIGSAKSGTDDEVRSHTGYNGLGGAFGSMASSLTSAVSDRMSKEQGVRLTLNMDDRGYATISQPGDSSNFSKGEKVLLRRYADGVQHVTAL